VKEGASDCGQLGSRATHFEPAPRFSCRQTTLLNNKPKYNSRRNLVQVEKFLINVPGLRCCGNCHCTMTTRAEHFAELPRKFAAPSATPKTIGSVARRRQIMGCQREGASSHKEPQRHTVYRSAVTITILHVIFRHIGS
jgi:hypothetical protein